MFALRALLPRRSGTAMLLLALALFTRALVPSGAMVGNERGQLTVSLCSEVVSAARTLTIDYERQDKGDRDAAGNGTCAFLLLGMAAIGGADAPLLAIALSFILALGFAALPGIAPRTHDFLRPPLRGPPAAA